MSRLRIEADGLVNRVWLDGQELKDAVTLDLALSTDAVSVATIEYACWEGVSFDGEAEVRHYCPLAEEER